MSQDLTAWPLATDVQELLTSAGAWDASAGLDLADYLDSSVEDLETAIDYSPFFNPDLVESTRFFNAPGPIVQPYATLMGGGNTLFLPCPIISISSLKVDGVEFSEFAQYYVGRDYNDGPIVMIRFANKVFSQPNGIEIIGVWGYCSTLPKLAFDAVKARAASKALPILAARRRTTAEENQNAQIKAKETGPIRTEYQTATADKTTDFSALKAQLDSDWRKAVRKFRLGD